MNEKAPVAGSKAMLEASPVAVSVTVPPMLVELFADTVKCRVLPTVAFSAEGAFKTGNA